ncbi:MAG: hypothetical protein C4527_08060 [Candidatus Omnitrophota bacterium]|jgi:hypothetical protein|nr:MAG: hypothetical protein C4527_08060 [Candidatus Omnitrophota bacterium]
MIRKKVVLSLALVSLGLTMAAVAGPKGVIIVRPLGVGVSITIDGNFDDWPLNRFEQPSVQPLFPEGQDQETTDARGDYIVYDPDRVGFFNTARGVVSEDDPHLDFEVNTYFAYDAEYLYILSIFIDDEIVGYHDVSDFGSQPYLNDGLEFFFDAKNDSDDSISDIQFPNIDDVEPNVDDFQIGAGLNDLFDAVVPENQGGFGVVMGIIRSGNRDLLGSGNFGDGSFQETMNATPGPDIAARTFADLRAVGAPNVVIAENPGLTFRGYVIELRVKFGLVDGFTPDHAVGFTVFWRDVDDSSGGSIQFMDWAQSTTASGGTTLAQSITDIFYAPNWGALEFNTNNPLGGETGTVDWDLF